MVLKDLIGSSTIDSEIYGKNDMYMCYFSQFLNFEKGSIDVLLNEIKFKPSLFDIKLIIEYKDVRNLDSVLWINYYNGNENDINILNKEMKHLKLFFKIVWDYEYYYFNKVEATIEIGKTELHSITLKCLFLYEPEGSPVIYFLIGDLLEIDLMKKKNIKEIKMNNLLCNLWKNGLNFGALQQRLYKNWREEFAYGKTMGLLYYFPPEGEDMEEINKKKENFNKQVERNVEWVKERIEGWREEWEVERREGRREFFKE
jgi:hypothetical protein